MWKHFLFPYSAPCLSYKQYGTFYMKFDRDNSITCPVFLKTWTLGKLITMWAHVPVGHKSLLKWKDFWLALCLVWCAFLMELFLRTACTLMSLGKGETSPCHVLAEQGWECLCIWKFKEYKSLMICWLRNVKSLARVFGKTSCANSENNHNIKTYWKVYCEYAV